MIVREVIELSAHRHQKRSFEKGLSEMQQSIESVDANKLIAWHFANGKESDKSLSRAVNALILQNLSDLNWELNWSFAPSVKSNHATFESSKQFEGQQPIRFAMDVASRHSNEALGYLIKGQLARKRRGSEIRQVDAHVLISFTQACLEWGRWNGAVYPHEKLVLNLPLVEAVLKTPVWIFAVDPPNNLRVAHSLAGTLKLEILNT